MAAGEGNRVRIPLPRTGSADSGEPARSPTPALHFTVLDAVHIYRDGAPLPSGTPQQRGLLAALLLRSGRTATAHQLVDAMWEDPPPQALAALRTYASRLRKTLGPRSDILTSEAGGYALRLGPHDTLDVDQATELAAEAEKAAAGGDPALAHELYGRALAHWDGEPLAGVPGPAARMHRDRLVERQLTLQEQRLEVGLLAGLHAESVSELTALTTAHPLRERLRELLMLALYRCGRQAEALAVYADTRRILTEELGVDPRPELAELQQRILTADESLAHHPDESAGAAQAIVRPAQLPAAVSDFTGRLAFVEELCDQLSLAGGSVMALSAVAGIGGVGKTTLAVQVAHAAREHFPDGQLYIDLQGASTTPAEPEAVLGSFLRALGTSDSAIPEGVDERSALYRSLLDGRRVLALLDNARDAAQVRPLLPGTPTCAVLITSRNRLVDLAGAHLVDLDVMSPEEALALFTKIVGTERVGAEHEAAMDTVAACGFLPLAIRIAAARLAARRTWTVATLARKLSDERRRLDELTAGDQAVKATFELGYSQLEPEQARAFRLLGLAEGPDISLAAAAAILDRDPETAEDVLETLVDTSLIESAAPGRYRFHDLVRLFARACAERDEQPPTERDAALDRLLDFYLATAKHVYAIERPSDRTVDHLVATRHPGLHFDNPEDALDWLYTEGECLLASVRHAAGAGQCRYAADILVAATDLAESGALSRQYEQGCHATLLAAQRAGDTLAEGRAGVSLTQSYSVAGRFAEADAQAERVMQLETTGHDPIAQGYAFTDRAIIAIYEGRHQDAERYLAAAISTFRDDGNRPSEASALSNLSRVRLSMGQTDSAVTLAEESHAIYEDLGATLRLANARYALGIALTKAGRSDEAVRRLTAAHDTFHATRQQLWEGMTLFRLAEARMVMDEPMEAAALAEQALGLLRTIGGAWRRANVLTTLGEALNRTGQAGRARACWVQALEVFDELGSPEAAEVRRHLDSATV